jgi:hypothetical protein
MGWLADPRINQFIPTRRNQLYATVSVSGDAVVIEEEDGPGSDDRDDDGEEEDNGDPFRSDPRLAAVRWRQRAAAAVKGGAWMLAGEQSASSPRGGEYRGWGQDEVVGEGSPSMVPPGAAGQQAFVMRHQTV